MSVERQAQSKNTDPERSQRAPDAAEAAAELDVPAAPLPPAHAPAAAPNATAVQLRRANVAQQQRSLGNARVARRLAQREDAPAAASSAPVVPSAAAPAPAGLIVDDAAAAAGLQPGQMTKSAFLAQLRSSIEATAAAELGDSPLLGQARSQIDQQFAQYSALSGVALEQTIKRAVPDAAGATSAQAYIAPICARVRTTIAEQRAALPPGSEAVAGVVSSIADAASSVASAATSALSSIGSLFFKARAGGAQAPDDPRAIQAQLGDGHALDSRVQSGLESALGQNFSGVRVHSDAGAAGLSDQMNARAFTVGQDIAFGSGEYQPGTPIGDALIAHEVAHVAQQSGASPAAVQQKGESGYDALEQDADQSAVGAVAAMWGGLKGGLAKIGQNALPQLKSGLRLQKCAGPARSMPTPATPTPATPGTMPSTPTLPANVKHEDYVFIMGKDKKNAPSNKQFYTAATKFFSGKGNMVTDKRTLAAVFDYLRGLSTPIGNLYIVSHAAQDGTLSFGLNDADQDKHISYDELHQALKKSPDMFKLPPNLIDEQTLIHIKGCNIGRSKRMLDDLDTAFGGKGKVTAPTHKQFYEWKGAKTSEHLEVYFIEAKGKVDLTRAEQLAQFQAKYPQVSASEWNKLLPKGGAKKTVQAAYTLNFVDTSDEAEIEKKKQEEQDKLGRPEMYEWRLLPPKGHKRTLLLERTEYNIDKPIKDSSGDYLDPTKAENKRLQGSDDPTFFDVSTVSPAPNTP
jgi:hypothetical protein